MDMLRSVLMSMCVLYVSGFSLHRETWIPDDNREDLPSRINASDMDTYNAVEDLAKNLVAPRRSPFEFPAVRDVPTHLWANSEDDDTWTPVGGFSKKSRQPKRSSFRDIIARLEQMTGTRLGRFRKIRFGAGRR